ncbi:MAG: carboxypeptidase M32, partial [Kiloniellales bacterium]
MTAYRDLEARFKRLGALGEVAGLLQWDTSVMMPSGGAAARGEQLAALDVICHELISDPALADLLTAAEAAAADLDPWARANLREMRRRWRHATALEPALVEALSRTGTACEMIWRQARAEADFAMVLPKLKELLGLTRQAAAAKAEALGCAPYDALLDEFEPGGSSARIDIIFDDLAAFLPGFLGQVLERQAAAPAPLPLDGPFPLDQQRALARRL